MRTEVTIGANRFRVRQEDAHDLSIALRFGGAQPSAFGLPAAVAVPFEADGFVGEVARGGSVNCPTITLTPHGNVTHTECVGHVTADPVAVLDVLDDAWLPATLVTVAPRVVRARGGDFPEPVITLGRMREALASARPEFLDAVIVRTLPNDVIKASMPWSGTSPPYLEAAAMEYLVARGVRHLLLDLPSADPERDGGGLVAHRAFWAGAAGRRRTITEMVYVDNRIPDGVYVLNLQVAPFALDAAPSRPLLFPVEEVAS